MAGGKTLEAAAAAKGLSTSRLEQVSRDALSSQASKLVADAVFAAAQGTIATPARSGLGWHVMRVDAIAKRAERPLAQVRGEIIQQLTIENRRKAINDLSARIEEELAGGATLEDISKELGVTPQPTHGPPRAGDVRHSHADISAARSALGYEPEVSLRDGLARTVAWFREVRVSG